MNSNTVVAGYLALTIIVGLYELLARRQKARDLARLQQVVDGKVTGELRDRHRLAMAIEAEQYYSDDPRLVSLTRAVAVALNAPMALVTNVQDDRQCFLAVTDPARTLKGERETEIQESWCRYVVATKHPVEINEALLDPLVRDTGAVKEKGVRAYLGVPIHRDNEVIGSLCVLDIQPRNWTPDEERQLMAFAELADAILGE